MFALYTTPACLRDEYVTAIPIPKIPNAKKPGTSLRTVAPQDDAFANDPPVIAAVLTSVETGPIKDTPTKILTKPPIKFAIICSCFISQSVPPTLLINIEQYLNVGINLSQVSDIILRVKTFLLLFLSSRKCLYTKGYSYFLRQELVQNQAPAVDLIG